MGSLNRWLGREERDRGWYVDPNPKRLRVYVDSEENCVHDEWFRDRYWYRDMSLFFFFDFWLHTADSQARDSANNIRKKGITTKDVAYPAHRIHKVVISDYVDSTD
jgi:hypothetical protein